VRYLPRAVVIYAGDNDLDASTGKTAQDVARDFGTLVATIHAHAPGARIYFLSIKPSRARWFAALRAAGILVKNLSGAHPLLAQCLRITVGTPQENRILLNALREAL
jgi:histidinol-phosphate aminotransferase